MVGNVWEWCFDAYDENFYANSPHRNPIADIIIRDPENRITVNELRVTRGAGWNDGPRNMWIASRREAASHVQWLNTGFRCVKAVKP